MQSSENSKPKWQNPSPRFFAAAVPRISALLLLPLPPFWNRGSWHVVPILADFSVCGLDQLAFGSPLVIVSALAVVSSVAAVSPSNVSGPTLTKNACFKETIGKRHFGYGDFDAEFSSSLGLQSNMCIPFDFLEFRAYDKAAIKCNGREAVNFEPSTYEGEMKSPAINEDGSPNLELNLGIATPGHGLKENRRQLQFSWVPYSMYAGRIMVETNVKKSDALIIIDSDTSSEETIFDDNRSSL